MTTRLPILYAAIDDAQLALGEDCRMATGHYPSCTGCREASCCDYVALATPNECTLLAPQVLADKPTALRLRGWLEVYLSRLGRVQAGSLSLDTFLDEVVWQGLRQPCPFLHQKRCTVYSVRPASCRTLLVASDPALCRMADRVSKVTRIVPPPDGKHPQHAAVDQIHIDGKHALPTPIPLGVGAVLGVPGAAKAADIVSTLYIMREAQAILDDDPAGSPGARQMLDSLGARLRNLGFRPG